MWPYFLRACSTARRSERLAGVGNTLTNSDLALTSSIARPPNQPDAIAQQPQLSVTDGDGREYVFLVKYFLPQNVIKEESSRENEY